MFSSTSSKKGQIIKGNYRIIPLQMIEHQYGDYQLCQDINTSKIYTCKIVNKPYFDSIGIKNSGFISHIIDTQNKAASYEINISKNLKHRNILNLTNRLQDQNSTYLLYDYCNRGTLKNLLDSYIFSPKELISAYQQLVEGMIYFHRHQLQHMDINPNNIMVESYGQSSLKIYKIAGFSKLRRINVQDDEDDDNSQDSQHLRPVASDLNYEAPQLTKNQQFETFKSDVWSLGVVFYQMAYGKLPWSRKQIIVSQESNKKQSMSQQVSYPKQSRVPPSIVNLLEDMLQKSYQKRASMSQVQSILKKLAYQI